MASVWMLCLHKCMCTTYVQCPRKPGEGIKSLGTGVKEVVVLGLELRSSGRTASALNH
ncbi:hypothetical protein I79_002275 [Cricetulus griseus]|uniref:Uncharacterized protein n=1 Tax=Cricetulus griseus TaxID=10029 RepID=G3GWY8_CRIGR|nr:hypothetical protein I79_002275 [Cricetulus griseus]